MKKTFFEHLKELNLRIFISLSLVIIFSIFIYVRYPVFIQVLNEPLINAGYDKSNIAHFLYRNIHIFLNFSRFLSNIFDFQIS